jgi:hypothetical protein
METAQDALNGFRLIVLNKMGRKPDGGKDVFIEEFGKPAAVVSETLGPQQLNFTQRCIEYLHVKDDR